MKLLDDPKTTPLTVPPDSTTPHRPGHEEANAAPRLPAPQHPDPLDYLETSESQKTEFQASHATGEPSHEPLTRVASQHDLARESAHEIALDFPIGDGRTGRCHVRVYDSPEVLSHDSGNDAGDHTGESAPGGLVAALVGAPPGGAGYHLSLYTGAIAQALCARLHISPERLIYIDHDRDAGAKMSEWAILLGPQALYTYTAMVSEGTVSSDTFHLVAFDFEAGALVRPRFTRLSRLDVETFIGGPLEL